MVPLLPSKPLTSSETSGTERVEGREGGLGGWRETERGEMFLHNLPSAWSGLGPRYNTRGRFDVGHQRVKARHGHRSAYDRSVDCGRTALGLIGTRL